MTERESGSKTQDLTVEILKALRREMNQRFDGVEARFTGIDKRFDGVDKRLDGLDKRFDGLERGIQEDLVGLRAEMFDGFAEIQRDLERLGRRQESLALLRGHEQRLRRLEKKVGLR